MFQRLHRRSPVSAILPLLVILSLTIGLPIDTLAKTRKRAVSSKSKGKGAKAKAGSSRRGRYRLNARAGGRVRYTRVRVRGRNGRWVWKRRPMVAARVHGVGVHNYL